MVEGGEHSNGGLSAASEKRDSERRSGHEEMAERPGQPIFQNETGESLTLDQIERVGITIMIPTHEMVPFWFGYSLAVCMTYTAMAHPYIDMGVYASNGTILQNMRNELVESFLKTNNQWTVWFDSDMRFPRQTIERLLAHKQPIVGCNYPTRKWPAIEPVTHALENDPANQELLEGVDWHNDRVYPGKGLEAVRTIGMGCVAIHREVYETLDRPWFHLPWDEQAKKHSAGEDAYFCWRARRAGFDVMLDHDLSNEVAHIGMREFTLEDAVLQRDNIAEFRKELDKAD